MPKLQKTDSVDELPAFPDNDRVVSSNGTVGSQILISGVDENWHTQTETVRIYYDENAHVKGHDYRESDESEDWGDKILISKYRELVKHIHDLCYYQDPNLGPTVYQMIEDFNNKHEQGE